MNADIELQKSESMTYLIGLVWFNWVGFYGHFVDYRTDY